MVTAYPTLRLKLTMPTALKLQFLPALPGFNASQAASKPYVDAQSRKIVDGLVAAGVLTRAQGDAILA